MSGWDISRQSSMEPFGSPIRSTRENPCWFALSQTIDLTLSLSSSFVFFTHFFAFLGSLQRWMGSDTAADKFGTDYVGPLLSVHRWFRGAR
jgi:hypothetical protein